MSTSIFYLIFGIGFIGFGYYFRNRHQNLLKTGKRATAIIYKNEYAHGTRGGAIYYPVVRFLTERNEEIIQKTNIGSSRPKPEGEKVEVIYDPLNPREVMINSKFNMVTLPWIFIGAGLVSLLIAVMISFDLIAPTK